MFDNASPAKLWLIGLASIITLTIGYLYRINSLLKGVPDEVRKLAGSRWTEDQLRKTYHQLQINEIDYTNKIPPKQDRRYIVTGGNGLVGGYIVLQLLARGTKPANIRIVDVRKPERNDLLIGPATEIEYVHTDIRSEAAVSAAFSKVWDPAVAHLPLTVFHTAAVILASDRSKYNYDFPYAVNVTGTKNVLNAAKAAGADVFSSTSSASTCITPVNPWVLPWAKEPDYFWQVLDERDFDRPLRPKDEFFGNYPASKGEGERLVCNANSVNFRTGCIRPANGVYGNPTDNTVGGCLSRSVLPTWASHIVQNFVHGANVAIAHLQQEAALLSSDDVAKLPSAGRPFVVTDPNPPITYGDMYTAISTLSIHGFRADPVPPMVILLVSHLIEWLNLLPYRAPWLAKIIPEIKGDAKRLQPALFSICTHLVASDAAARKPIAQGGIGYEGVLTTMEGMAMEVLDWNREHGAGESSQGAMPKAKDRKRYTTSNAWSDQLRDPMNLGTPVAA